MTIKAENQAVLDWLNETPCELWTMPGGRKVVRFTTRRGNEHEIDADTVEDAVRQCEEYEGI